jgi:hypothetical protein
LFSPDSRSPHPVTLDPSLSIVAGFPLPPRPALSRKAASGSNLFRLCALLRSHRTVLFDDTPSHCVVDRLWSLTPLRFSSLAVSLVLVDCSTSRRRPKFDRRQFSIFLHLSPQPSLYVLLKTLVARHRPFAIAAASLLFVFTRSRARVSFWIAATPPLRTPHGIFLDYRIDIETSYKCFVELLKR